MLAIGAFLIGLLFVASAPASSAMSSVVDREVSAVIDALGASQCRFERNGSWHDAAAAQAHLRKKYDYLRKRGLAPTTETFIKRGASTSSRSGKPYRVRCGATPAMASATWLRARLAVVRRAAPPSR